MAPSRPLRVPIQRVLVPPAFPDGTRTAWAFASQVRRHLHEGVLTYSDRSQLIRFGQSLGFSRFHANLIIAAVQHEAQQASRTTGSAAAPKNPPISPLRALVLPAVGFVAVQATIVTGVWMLLN